MAKGSKINISQWLHPYVVIEYDGSRAKIRPEEVKHAPVKKGKWKTLCEKAKGFSGTNTYFNDATKQLNLFGVIKLYGGLK
jgi:hypothetical protein